MAIQRVDCLLYLLPAIWRFSVKNPKGQVCLAQDIDEPLVQKNLNGDKGRKTGLEELAKSMVGDLF